MKNVLKCSTYISAIELLHSIHPAFLDFNQEGRKEMFYLTTHSTHFIYGYMASDIW